MRRIPKGVVNLLNHYQGRKGEYGGFELSEREVRRLKVLNALHLKKACLPAWHLELSDLSQYLELKADILEMNERLAKSQSISFEVGEFLTDEEDARVRTELLILEEQFRDRLNRCFEHYL